MECNYLIVNGLESCIYWLHVILYALRIDISISNLCHLKVISRTTSYHRCKVIRYSFPQVVQSLKNETQHYRYLVLYTFADTDAVGISNNQHSEKTRISKQKSQINELV